MNAAQKATVMQFFKAVGQPDRLRMLGLLANEQLTIPQLAHQLGLKETAVSRNIRALKKAGLVAETSDTKTAVFQLNQAGLAQMQQIVEGETIPETYEQRIMKQYIQDETLRAIPNDEQEREIILNWLTDKFDLEKRYTEEEVTAIVAKHYQYPLTLRRLLADNQFLMQTGRHYWRPLPKYK